MSDTVDSLNEALSDRYRIERELGRGGMGTVFLAQDLRHDREVALKVVDPGLVHAVGAERFLQEIRIAATLQHPHILPLFDSGEAEGNLFYAMPFVEGRSLRELLQAETQLPVERAVKIGRELAAGLAHAHSRDVVHRDIKPENILLYGGYAVLADFGVASALSQAGAERLTPSGLAMGSPSYMAPEQMRADGKVDGRTDVYALGCVLYEMLVGDPPFTGPTATVVMARHASDPVPSIRTVRSTVSPELEEVIMRCLAKVPADRYGSAEEVVQALEEVGTAPGGPPPQEPSPVGAPAEGLDAGPSTTEPSAGPGTPPEGTPPPDGPPSSEPPSERLSFFQELKRRNVYQAAVIYGVVALSLVQGAQLAFPTFGIEWAFDFVVMAAVLGFPLVLVLAWVYDLTRHGIRRTTPWATPLPEQIAAEAARRKRRAFAFVGAAGIVAFVGLYPFGYGEATVPLDTTRGEASRNAGSFLADQGAVGTFHETRLLRQYGADLAYLQWAVGFDEARRLTESEIPVWRWDVRWFRPGEPEDWQLGVGPEGRIRRFLHRVPDTFPGAHLEGPEALELAHGFLRELGWDPEELEQVQETSLRRGNRTDHTFVWHVTAEALPWAPSDGEAGSDGEDQGGVHVHLRVQGDRLGFYWAHLDVPESFQREANRRRAIGSGLLFFSVGAVWLLSVILLIVLARRGWIEMRWKVTLAATVAAGALLALVMGLDFVPGELYDYPTERPRTLFLGELVLISALVGLGFGGALVLPLAGATDVFGRLVWPERMEGWTRFFRGELRNPVAARDLRSGFVLAGLLLGWGALSKAVQVRVPDVWGLRTWGAAEHAGDPLPALSLAAHAGFEAVIGVLFLAAALAILTRYLKSAAVAVVLLAVVAALLTTEGTYPLYVSASLGAVEVLLVAVVLVAFGPLVALAGAYVHAATLKATPFLLLGETEALLIGLGGLAFALLPAVPILLSRSGEGEAEAEGPGPGPTGTAGGAEAAAGDQGAPGGQAAPERP